uniref:Endoplasmic reticulum junction formation protein lunapark n=1 Tax=Lygus hesperus TaxID=30085 RepID=A0A0A9YZY6_LYGHE
MGLIISRYRKKKNSEEVLEQLQKDIDTIEHRLQYSTQRQKVIIGKLLIYSIVFYLLIAVVSYFYLFPSTWKGRALICVPIFGIPLLIFYAKQFVSWIYTRDMTRSRDKLADLLKKKKKTLEDVMNTETYKKAKDILDKYAPEQTRKQSPLLQPLTQPKVPRNEQISQNPAVTRTPLVQTLQRRTPSPARSPLPQRQQMPTMLVRPIFPKDRGMFDKLVESLIGDGPNNRYALICKNCASHNGMALKEEFEYLAFKCVYCGFPNPSRKVRPRLSLGPGQLPRRSLFPLDGSPIRQAIEDAGASSDNESGVKIEEVTDEIPAGETNPTVETNPTEQETKQSEEEEVVVPTSSGSSSNEPGEPTGNITTETCNIAETIQSDNEEIK